MADDQQRAKEQPPHPKGTNSWMVVIALLCVAGSIYYGFREFGDRSKEQTDALNAQTAVMKSQMEEKIYEEKMATGKRVTEAASKIAALKSAGSPQPQTDDAVAQFRTLAWGPAAVTDGENFKQALELYTRGLDAGADAGQLQQLSLALAGICGNELHASSPPRSPANGSPNASQELLAKMKEIVRVPESQNAAAQWIGLVDAGQYPESWKTASDWFQSTIPQERWERAIAAIRKPMGNLVTRKLKSAVYSKQPPGAPEGDYMVLQFDVSFPGKSDGVETVTMMSDKDGKWRAASYAIK